MLDISRRAALLAGLFFAGCAFGGPSDPPEFAAQIKRALPADDNALVFTFRVQIVNVRTRPSIGQAVAKALLTGVQERPMEGGLALTENAIYLLGWFNSGGGDRFHLLERMPLAGIVRADLGERSWVEIESREPMHPRLGQPDQTSLYRIAGLQANGLGSKSVSEETYAAIRKQLAAAGTGSRSAAVR